MSKFDGGGFNAGTSQCFVCEKIILADNWYAQVKRGEWTVRLCCPQCANAFYAKRLPSLRQLALMAGLASRQWPSPEVAILEPA